jgi:PKD repeat protein
MKSIKICILPIIASILLLIAATPLVLADETNVIDDPEDDVIVSTPDTVLGSETEIEKTSEKPNIDITKVTYFYSEQDDAITLTLEVKGSIEDKNDLDTDADDLNLTGSLVQYTILLETSNNSYTIIYMDQNCTLNDEDVEYTKSSSSLSVTFDKLDSEETYEACYGYTMEFDIVSIADIGMYMDIAPDDATLIAEADFPDTGEVGEEITFTGSYYDAFGVTTGPYTYTWDFDDGTSTETGETVTHTFQYAGTYTVELTLNTGDIQTSYEKDIVISEKSDNNDTNNTGNGGSEPADGDGSQLMLFVVVVVVIIIIGVIALVYVIRR